MEEKFYWNDILSQDRELDRAMRCYRSEAVRRKLEALSGMDVKKVVFSGMGSSHFCAYGASIYLKQHGIDSEVISTGELLYYEEGCLTEDTVLCLISQSGESAETRHLLERLPEGIFVIALTNDAQSALGRRGDICFLMNVSDEISVTTRTYVSSLVMTQLIAAALCGEALEPVFAEYERAVGCMGAYLAHAQEETERLRDFCRGMQSLSLMGRGNALSSVRSGALFLREVAKFTAVDFDSAEFRHGPMELVEEGFFAAVFAPTGVGQELGVRLAQSIAEKGGRVLLITDPNGVCRKVQEEERILAVVLPEAKEYASQLLQIIPIQLLADAIARDKGIVPGVFRWGSKITAVE